MELLLAPALHAGTATNNSEAFLAQLIMITDRRNRLSELRSLESYNTNSPPRPPKRVKRGVCRGDHGPYGCRQFDATELHSYAMIAAGGVILWPTVGLHALLGVAMLFALFRYRKLTEQDIL